MSGAPLPRTLVRDLAACVGASARVCGWLHEVDALRPRERALLRDHTGVVPLSVVAGDTASRLAGVTRESAIDATGIVGRDGEGSVHLLVESLRVAGAAAHPVPLDRDAALERRLDWRFLDLRDPRHRLIFAVQTTAERAMREVWERSGFLEVHSPKLRPLPSKSGGDLFAVDYFERRVYLAQSPQWYKQMAMAAGFDRVFEIGPVFRPQPERSTRHATEFTSIDVEISWVDSMGDVIAHAEDLLHTTIAAVQRVHGDEIAARLGVEVKVPERPFPRVTFADAMEMVERSGHRNDGDEDLDPEGERRLAQHVHREHAHEFVFVVDYPARCRPYYHMLISDRSPDSRSFDLLYRGLEIASGAQREHRHERLVAQAQARGVPVDKVRTYLDFFKYGCPPHGGFGLGLTRLLMSLLHVDDVREVTYLFRGRDRVAP